MIPFLLSLIKVIEPTVAGMRAAMIECWDVEHLIRTHEEYTSSLLQQCLLQEKVIPLADRG